MRKEWEIMSLGELCTVIAGQSPEGKYYNDKGVGMPFYQGKKEFTEKFIGAATTWTSVSTKEAIKGDILMSVRAPVGPVNFSTQNICIGRGLAAIRPNKQLDKDYLFYFLVKHEDEIEGNAGAVFNSINKTQIENIKIPIPPLPEQKRIVAILDSAFAAIDRAKANIEKNLENARELFESYLRGVFASPGKDWDVKNLGEACELIMGQSPPGESYNTNGKGIPLINGPVEFGPEPFSQTLKAKFTTAATKFCQKGDLILCVRGSTTGRINISGFDACIGRGVAAIRYSKNQAWLNYFILSSRQKIYNLGTGATFPNVSSEMLKKLDFPVPPSKEQEVFLGVFNGLLSETKMLQEIYKNKLRDLEELKKSILQKAFSGELTSSNKSLVA